MIIASVWHTNVEWNQACLVLWSIIRFRCRESLIGRYLEAQNRGGKDAKNSSSFREIRGTSGHWHL